MRLGQNIFITGAGGFIGKHLVESAVQAGFGVIAMIRRKSDAAHLKQAAVVYGDVTDGKKLRTIFSDLAQQGITIDYVVHAAALTKENAKSSFFETNVQGTGNLVKALQEADIFPRKIIFISSLAACGAAALGSRVRVEDNRPISNYGRSKLQAEPLIKNSGMPYIILRPTAVYGPGEKDLLTVFKFISKGINPLLGNRPQELTFIYVSDLVNVILKAITSTVANRTYFVSDGNIYSRKDLTAAISKGLNKKPVNLVVPLPLVKAIAFMTQNVNRLFRTAGPLNLDKYHELVAESWNCDLVPTILDLEFEAGDDLYSGAQKTIDWYKQHKWI